MTSVALTSVGHVARIEFDNGHGNYFTADLLNQVADCLLEARSAGSRAAVLCSTGRHFCAGADFSAIGASVDARSEVATDTYAAGMRIFEQPLPIVAAVQGAAIGGGLGLACAADFRVATAESRFEANFTRLGFHPGFGLSVVLPRIVGQQTALELLLTAQRINGLDALAIGLVDRLVEADELHESAMHFASEIASLAPLAVQAVKATMRGHLLDELKATLAWEAAEQRRLWGTRDAEIGMAAAQERQPPTFVGR